MLTIPLLLPLLPEAEAILPYLRRIDARQHYTNFGPLQEDLLQRLVDLQQAKDGCTVHGVLTTSATLGLELALAALDLPAGSRVAVPALTFLATGTVIERCGHIPVVIDVDARSWLLTPVQMPQDMVIQNIRAVIPVATFGMPQDAKNWSAWSEIHNIPVILDAAAAFGAQKTSTGVIAVFSLHATKTLSSGEGGLILTQDPALANRLRAMTNFGIGLTTPSHASNAKMSEYHAAIGLAHLAIWPAQVAARMQLLQRYRNTLSAAQGVIFKFQNDTGLFAPSLLCIQLATPELRDRLELNCAQAGIQTRRWYLPLLQFQPLLATVEAPTPTIQAQYLAETLLGLPFFLNMTNAQFEGVVKMVLGLNHPTVNH
jgi:dTDP-4-amino-4,6-dideoxygalactose transaminase